MIDVSGDAFEVPNAKIVDYLLCADHPRGGAKARYFEAFGFTATQPLDMARALIAHATDPRNTLHITDRQGRSRLIVEGPIAAPDGRRPRIRAVWQRHAEQSWRLITAVPIR